jgi:guanine nucleotide-binding protein subunit alpha
MKIIHQEGFSEAELAEYTPTIYKNVLESAHSVVMFMKKIGLECEEYSNRVRRPALVFEPYSTKHPVRRWQTKC